MKTLFVLLLLLFSLFLLCSAERIKQTILTAEEADEKLEALVLLKKAYEKGIIDHDEYEYRKTKMLDEITGVQYRPHTNNGTVFTPQVKFLLNQMYKGLPRSYDDTLPTGDNYWVTSIYLDIGAIDPWGTQVELDSQIAIQERTLTRFGLNLYDGATWEIALALVGLGEVALVYERNILYTSGTGPDTAIGGIINIRADAVDFKYGSSGISGDRLTQITLAGNASRVVAQNGVPTSQITKKQAGAFFYRMIGPKYAMTDPLDGDYGNAWKYPWPNNDTTTPWNIGGVVHWNDWKPITGENVWAAITGPVQTLWIMNGTRMEDFLTFERTPAPIQLAISILPALKALQSPLGSLYHCPKGTKMFPPDPSEETNVSNENNFSGYAALKMLYQILVNKSAGSTDGVLVQAKNDLLNLLQGLEGWFSKYLFSESYQGYRVVYQGGHVSFSGAFDPVPIEEVGGFAVDCQTWGMIVLGQANVDKWYGFGTAYQVWQATKKFAGYYNPEGKLGGVGYTIVNGDKSGLIWSAEWTWGAVYACEKLAAEYDAAGQPAWAAELRADAQSMIDLMTQPIVRCENLGWCGGGLVQEDGSYVYANSRFFIPWGWYANPLGATCSTAWAVMHDYSFNPFILGGGPNSPFAADEEFFASSEY